MGRKGGRRAEMNMFNSYARPRSLGVALGIACIAFMTPAEAQAPAMAMLKTLQSGEWEVRFRDGSPPRRICVRDGGELIQLRHRDPNCNRFIVEDTQGELTVQYTCRGNGYGRTNIRRESGTLVQLQSQGIEGGLPFSFTAEGRRVGACR